MQVKKFEARTMKEALEMVKNQLGPDAIILSARDNSKSFGLVGDGSVEITAAVSEETLQRKKFAESRFREQDRVKFVNSPARTQKEIIEKMVSKHIDKTQPRQITTRRYAEIDTEESTENLNFVEDRQAKVPAYEKRSTDILRSMMSSPVATQPAPAKNVAKSNVEAPEIQSLKNEIESLKKVITQFSQLPQNFITQHPGASYGLPFELSFMFEKLVQTGVSEEIAADLMSRAMDSLPAMRLKNKALVEGWVARYILSTVQVVAEPSQAKVHVFTGPAGSGKTTALVKFASHLVVRENKKVALITTDTYKVGAADQMRIYAQILNVPFAIIRNQEEWGNIMRYLGNVDCVLVDVPGLSLRNAEEVESLKRLMPPSVLGAKTHLVLSATSKDQDVTESARRYSVIGYNDAIFTGLDESTQHGNIYNFTRRFEVPLHSFGIGPRVPEDFEYATKERLLDLILKITQHSQPESEAL